jgi:hypothetical protein
MPSVIQQLADGEVPADLAIPLLSATGFAFAKPDGGIRPVAFGVALRRLAFRTILRASIVACTAARTSRPRRKSMMKRRERSKTDELVGL